MEAAYNTVIPLKDIRKTFTPLTYSGLPTYLEIYSSNWMRGRSHECTLGGKSAVLIIRDFKKRANCFVADCTANEIPVCLFLTGYWHIESIDAFQVSFADIEAALQLEKA